MFGCIDNYTKQARIRCILTNHTKNILLSIVKKYVNKRVLLVVMMKMLMNKLESKLSYFLISLKVIDLLIFYNSCYILKLINHSFWFGAVILHTNTIESL